MLENIKAKASSITRIAKQKAKSAGSSDQYVVGLDIGTENVKALIARVAGDEIEIVGVGRAHQGLSDMQAGAIADIAGVVANCDAALAAAEAQAGVSAKLAVIGIAGELVKGTTTTVRCTRKNADKPLDASEVEKIIELVQNRAQAIAKQQMSVELGGKAVDIRLVNSALVSIEIDGYIVTNPIGFQGKEVLVQLYTAFAPLIHIGALERTAQQLDLDLIAVAAEPFAVARAMIGNDTNATMNAILMDIGGGTTDIAVINEGGVQGTKMFGIGGRAYTRAIERQTDTDFETAEQLKLNYEDADVPKSKAQAVQAAISKTLDVWTSGVELALADFPKLDHLPHRILLCGGGSSLDALMVRMEETDWFKELPFTRKPQVQYIDPTQVVGVTDLTGSVTDHTYITAMGLLRVGVDTLAQDEPVTTTTASIKQRFNRMLRT